VAEWITSSGEWLEVNRRTELGPSLQASRSAFVQSFPKARTILDLGGTGLEMPEGALVAAFRYPYDFDELVIVDLPSEDRHEIYREGQANDPVETPQGTVRYRYHSMTDLSGIASGSFDLVYLGQAIEHVSVDEADQVLAEVRRVLRPTGHLALDTPNARVTRLQQAEFVDPDHKYEYNHAEMVEKLQGAGFEILESKGLNYAGRSLKAGTFSMEEVAGRSALYDEIADCYLLSYLCRPVHPGS
jgi:SAM-dependent methyltransferase